MHLFVRCDDCNAMCVSADSVSMCADKNCMKASCNDCCVHGLCVSCNDDVRGVVSSMIEKTAFDNKDIDAESDSTCPSAVSCCRIPMGEWEFWEPSSDWSDHYWESGFLSDDVCEHALSNAEQNGVLHEGCKAVEESIKAKPPVKLTLKVKTGGVVKSKVINRLSRYKERTARKNPFGGHCAPHYGASEPVRVGVKLEYCPLKSQRHAPVKLVWNLFRNTTHCSPPGWRSYQLQ